MSGNVAFSRSMLRGLGLVTLTLWLAPGAYANCLKDRSGEVYCGGGQCARDREGIIWCSRFYHGGAEITREGDVLCGRGQCVKTSRGQIFCSAKISGSAVKDSRGRVRCYGECEPAQAASCENTLAGSSE